MGQGHQGCTFGLTKITCPNLDFVSGWGMALAGYSGTPLWKKLGFKPRMKVCVLNAPAHYAQLVDGPNDWVMVKSPRGCDAIHLFITEKAELKAINVHALAMPPAIMLWVSWPKKTSTLSKGLSEDDIRKAALACGLVDIKVCAVDAYWSGLKLTRRRSGRTGA